MKIYYNPDCSKCAEALEIIRQHGEEPEIVEYLNAELTEEELKQLIQKLGISAEDLVRKKEELYKEKYEGKVLSEEEWIKVMIENPVLIERPIIVKDDKVILGRPPRNVLTLFS
jgi:arsenate reductase (glutaredoxin)